MDHAAQAGRLLRRRLGQALRHQAGQRQWCQQIHLELAARPGLVQGRSTVGLKAGGVVHQRVQRPGLRGDGGHQAAARIGVGQVGLDRVSLHAQLAQLGAQGLGWGLRVLVMAPDLPAGLRKLPAQQRAQTPRSASDQDLLEPGFGCRFKHGDWAWRRP